MGVFRAFHFRVFPLKGAYYHNERCQKDVMVLTAACAACCCVCLGRELVFQLGRLDR